MLGGQSDVAGVGERAAVGEDEHRDGALAAVDFLDVRQSLRVAVDVNEAVAHPLPT